MPGNQVIYGKSNSTIVFPRGDLVGIGINRITISYITALLLGFVTWLLGDIAL